MPETLGFGKKGRCMKERNSDSEELLAERREEDQGVDGRLRMNDQEVSSCLLKRERAGWGLVRKVRTS